MKLVLFFFASALLSNAAMATDFVSSCKKSAALQYPGMKVGEIEDLCVGATSAFPLNCFNRAAIQYSNGTPVSMLTTLCAKASSLMPLSCFNQMIANYPTVALTASANLCARAKSLDPISCFTQVSLDHVGSPVSDIVEICKSR